MPTAARMTAAVLFGLLALAWAFQASPYFPEAQEPHYWVPLNGAAGAIIGWLLCGTKAGNGYRPGLSNGITTIVAVLFAVFFIMSFLDMVKKSLRRSYDGPVEAVVNVFEIMLEWIPFFLVQDLGILIVGGAIMAGLITEFVGKRLP